MKKFIIIAAFISFSVMACNQAGQREEQAADASGTGQLVQISTQHGDIVLRLYDETPLHRDNFLRLAQEGFFDGTLFHRVIQGFMIQGGDPDSRDAAPEQRVGSGGPGYTIPAEIVPGLIHKKGALAAARMGDQVNPERESSGSQFYIVQGRVFTPEELEMMAEQRGLELNEQQRQTYTSIGGTPHLDNAYTVFGEVVEGLEVVDKIAATPTGAADRPLENIPMKVVVLK